MFRLFLILFGASAWVALSAGCSSINALADRHGVWADESLDYIGQGRYRLTVRGAAQLFDGGAEVLFQRKAQGLSRGLGCPQFEVSDFRAGVENSLLGGRRFASGIVACR